MLFAVIAIALSALGVALLRRDRWSALRKNRWGCVRSCYRTLTICSFVWRLFLVGYRLSPPVDALSPLPGAGAVLDAILDDPEGPDTFQKKTTNRKQVRRST